MYRILFVCHGNICRSPMAESVFCHMLQERGLSGVTVGSAATHTDEIGNPPHRGTRETLSQKKIPLIPHRATLLQRADGEKYDLLLGMDEANVRNMKRIVGKEYEDKVVLFLSFTSSPRSVADPWYTGDFEATFQDVVAGCNALMEHLIKTGKIVSGNAGDSVK